MNKYLEEQARGLLQKNVLAEALEAETGGARSNARMITINRLFPPRGGIASASGVRDFRNESRAMPRCCTKGARGYVSCGAAQRRLREAYFIGIVTPCHQAAEARCWHDLPAASYRRTCP